MKKSIYFILAFLLSGMTTKAQSTAMDFQQTDCSGQFHHLFAELDSGNLVVMEFIMTCNSCIVAGHALESMIADLDADYPGKIRWYQLAYTNSYTCATMLNFKTTNGFVSSVFDQGAGMMAYYGGFGMPTIAVAAGPGHDVLFTDVGFSISDTTAIGIAARNFFLTSGVQQGPEAISKFNVYPNPSDENISVALQVAAGGKLEIQIVDMSGKIAGLSQFEVSAGEVIECINVASYVSGLYMVKATLNGKEMVQRVIISHE